MRVRWSGLSLGDLAANPVERNVGEVVAAFVILLGLLFEAGAIIKQGKSPQILVQLRNDEQKDIPREPIGHVFKRGQHIDKESARSSDCREFGESLMNQHGQNGPQCAEY